MVMVEWVYEGREEGGEERRYSLTESHWRCLPQNTVTSAVLNKLLTEGID